ncbi:MAG: polysaccharide deacetylase family protein [Polyangiaceae bacterium]|nr:polysaccharide deacetylase family protein [Polyangiaceae bacterium]
MPVEPATFELRVPVPGEDAIEPGGGANVVLSFDDGPGRGRQAAKLLDVLARERVRAILFPTSDWTRARPEWLARARGDGHLVCNHTETHRDLRRLGDAELRREIAAGHGHDGGCALLRPPMRGYDERVARVAAELGYRLFLWHVDTRDWEGATADEIEGRVLAGVRPGAVVLFHIQADATLDALPGIVARLRRVGYVPSYDPEDLGPGLFLLRDEPTESAAAAFALSSGLAHAPGPAWWAAGP